MEGQIATQEARTRFAQELASSNETGQPVRADDGSSKAPVDQHHHIPDSQKHYFDLRLWFTENVNDPTLKVSYSLPFRC